MKRVQAAFSFLFVTAGAFFIAGWCLLPSPGLEQAETSRLERLQLLARMDWGHNWWGFLLGPSCGGLSAWLTFRNSGRKSLS
jgi:hypothetical protein